LAKAFQFVSGLDRMAHNISSVRSENEKQIEAFKQIVALRAHIDTLQRELVDLKRRAIQNIGLEMGKTSAEDIQQDKEMMETVEGTAELLQMAREKFEDFDKNKSGFLDGDEMLLLAEWVWSVFSAGGEKVDRVDQILASNDLRGKFDKNQDGVLDFEEFAEWFLNTVNNLKRLHKVEKDAALVELKHAHGGPGGEFQIDDLHRQMRNGAINKRLLWQQLASKSPSEKRGMNAGLASKLQSMSQPRSVSPYDDQNLPNSIPQSPRSLSHKVQLKAEPRNRKPEVNALMSQYSSEKDPLARAAPNKQPGESFLIAQESDAWKCLLKFSKPARNCIQLFLRLDREQQHYLGVKEIHSLLQAASVGPSLWNQVTEEFVAKFQGVNQTITLEQFADFLPPEATEKDIYIIIVSILEELGHNNFVE